MSKLSEFYSIKSQIFEGDVESEAKWDAIEEKLIREELLPEITELIKPVISQVKSPLSIQVNYDPKGNLAVSATRNCIQAFLPMEQLAHTTTSTPVATIAEPIKETTDSKKEDMAHNTHAKSVGIRVLFRDGTIIQEDKAVDTFIKALQRIGLPRLAKGNHGAIHAGFRLVGTEKRTSTTKKQAFVDGYYIYIHMSNEDKVNDLKLISDYYNLGLKVEWLGEKPTITTTKKEPKPTKQDTLSKKEQADRSIRGRFRKFMLKRIMRITANSYISTLDNAVRPYIAEHIDADADSIFSFNTPEEVEVCIGILNELPDFVAENEKRHHSLSAALKQYQSFIASKA